MSPEKKELVLEWYENAELDILAADMLLRQTLCYMM